MQTLARFFGIFAKHTHKTLVLNLKKIIQQDYQTVSFYFSIKGGNILFSYLTF